jgi:hypothetical protein
MSESNLTYKLTEAITNVVKKTKVFEKLQKIEFYTLTFLVITSFYGITNLVINQYNLKKIKENQNKNQIKNKEILENYFTQYNKILEEKINNIEIKLSLLLEKKENNVKNISESNKLSTSHIEEDELEYTDLFDECYDNLPCNNSKKLNGINSLFIWK